MFNSIRGLVKAKALHEQVASMEKIAAQMKANKEKVHKKIHELKQRIDQLIHDITVSFIEHKRRGNSCSNIYLEYTYDSNTN